MKTFRKLAAMAAASLLLPGAVHAFAELEVLEYSRRGPGSDVTYGYFDPTAADLISATEDRTPVGDGSDDIWTYFDYLYQDVDRVNQARIRGPAVGPDPVGHHSFANASGYADAGANDLGNYNNLGGFAWVIAGDAGSTAVAYSSAKVEFSVLIGPGESGAVAGDPATDLRWEFDTEGSLSVGGLAYPNSTAAAAVQEFHAIILRGPTGMCGPFDCPHGAYAASVDLRTALDARSRTPGDPGDPTGQITRDRAWDARNNSTLFGGGTLIRHGAIYDELRVSTDDEGVYFSDVTLVDTGGSPLDLSFIEFDATVGETLTVEAELNVAASVEGFGDAKADMFGSFSTRIFDPLGRGYEITFSIAPVPEPQTWAMLLPGLAVLGIAARRRRVVSAAG